MLLLRDLMLPGFGLAGESARENAIQQTSDPGAPSRPVVGVGRACVDRTQNSGPGKIDPSATDPGMMAGFVLAGQEAEVTVPADEAFGIGTFTVKIPAPDFDSGPVVTDGGLEAVWIADVDGRRSDDAVFAVRNAGSRHSSSAEFRSGCRV